MADQVHRGNAELLALRPEIWSALFYPTLLQNLPFNSIIARDYEGEIQQLGDRVNVTDFPQFDDAESIQEDERVDADSVTANKTQLIIDQQVVKDYIITSRAQIQTIDAADALRNLAFFALMKQMQRIIINTIVDDNPLSYTSGTDLDLPDILAAKEELLRNDVPQEGWEMIVGSAQWCDLFNITGFTSSDFVSSRPNETGQPPVALFSFNPNMTTEVGQVSHFLHPQALEMAVQRTLDVTVHDLGVDGKRALRVNSTILFGVVQMDAKRLVTIS